MRVELLRQRLGDAGDADIPGDVAGQFARGQAEIAERARDQAAVMVRGQQERRAALRILFENRRNFILAEE